MKEPRTVTCTVHFIDDGDPDTFVICQPDAIHVVGRLPTPHNWLLALIVGALKAEARKRVVAVARTSSPSLVQLQPESEP